LLNTCILKLILSGTKFNNQSLMIKILIRRNMFVILKTKLLVRPPLFKMLFLFFLILCISLPILKINLQSTICFDKFCIKFENKMFCEAFLQQLSASNFHALLFGTTVCFLLFVLTTLRRLLKVKVPCWINLRFYFVT